MQFLPQDKVVEFAKLKPKELLEETEKAIGDSSLFQKHMDLIAKRNSLKTFEVVSLEPDENFLEILMCKLTMPTCDKVRDILFSSTIHSVVLKIIDVA